MSTMTQCNLCQKDFYQSTLAKFGGICGYCFRRAGGVCVNCPGCNCEISSTIIEKYGLCPLCFFPQLEKNNSDLKEENAKLQEENEKLKAHILELRLSPDAGDLYLKAKNEFEKRC